jgi:hypothetical protein
LGLRGDDDGRRTHWRLSDAKTIAMSAIQPADRLRGTNNVPNNVMRQDHIVTAASA